MSPKVADPFSGHLPDGDPRGPLSAAAGCIWPTVPPYRFHLISDDATAGLGFLNTRPIVFEFVSDQPAHDQAFWSLLGTHPDVSSGLVVKEYDFFRTGYAWAGQIWVNAFFSLPLLFRQLRPIERCNRDCALPNVAVYEPIDGVTGDTFRLEQIEWDKTSPPP
jgi:hypothetical protein